MDFLVRGQIFLAEAMMRVGFDLAPEGNPDQKNLPVVPSNFVILENYRTPLFAVE